MNMTGVPYRFRIKKCERVFGTCFSLLVLRLLQHAVHQHQRKHCFGDRDDPGDDAGVVPAAILLRLRTRLQNARYQSVKKEIYQIFMSSMTISV